MIGKYVWLIETILRVKRISFKDINKRWKDNEEMSGGDDLPLRTFNNWRYAIQDMFGLFIENERCGDYRYYICSSMCHRASSTCSPSSKR